MNSENQPVIQLSEMQSTFEFKLPALPPLIGIQPAYADQSITFNDNLVTDCQQSGTGANNPNCDFIGTDGISIATQDPPAGASNLYDVIVNIDGLNNCDEFDAGDNNADCIGDPDHIVGPVTQTNNPNVNPVGTNEIDIVTDDNMLNDCTESGNGNNNAVCHNIGSDTITEITQNNFVDATSIGVNFVESNTINTLQGFDETNDCDEAGDGANSANCVNDVENLIGPIGPIDQSNDVTSTDPNTIHSNNIEVSQIGATTNDCNESGADAGVNDATCSIEAANIIDSI
ncbi:MAG TPA: hypothetical protein VL854_11300, partial [Nitrososphaeraceae archaeon]|nr:hypothetical protein [Nitrososphaeraceae archaeon]